jgi:hypothetical protein
VAAPNFPYVAAVIDALALVRSPRPSHDAHDPRSQLTDGQEIDVSSAGTKPRPPSAISTAGSGGIGRSGDGGQPVLLEEEADDGTSEA